MKSITFIVNPLAGARNKKNILSLISLYLDRSKYNYKVAFTQYAGHATELAASSKSDIICAIGGDGTLNEVARGLVGTAKTFALIPCGSGDGLALHLGISRDPLKAIKTINEAHVETLDYGLMNGKPFFSISGVGLDAIVSYGFSKSQHRGLRTYVSEALKTWKNFQFEQYTVKADTQQWSGPAALISVGNSNQWGNQARITSQASVTDGLLDVTIIKPFRTAQIPGIVCRLMTGKMHKCRHALCLRGTRITVERQSGGPAHCDGDPFMMGREIKWEAIPHALNMIVPDRKKHKI